MRATIVTDLGYGDAGKGSVVDYLCRDHGGDLVIRFNGGSQAAHNVITPDGVHHTFAQFGSGTFADAKTHLSRFMLINPFNMMRERDHLLSLGLSDPLLDLTVDRDAVVITPYHVAINRLSEMSRSPYRHGSCGQGVGAARFDQLALGTDTLLFGDLLHPDVAEGKLEILRQRKWDYLKHSGIMYDLDVRSTPVLNELHKLDMLSSVLADSYNDIAGQIKVVGSDYLSTHLSDYNHVVFEGAQGVLLDETYGFHPYTTWTDTTNANAETLLREAGFDGDITRLGLLRAYATRHGAGPFVTEDTHLAADIQDIHNIHDVWQKHFRVGWFDAVSTKYALQAVNHTSSVDGLVITCIDRLYGLGHVQICTSYDYGKDISFVANPSFSDQSHLTDWLKLASPDYTLTDVVGEIDYSYYVKAIEELLDKPVVMTSHGPTATSKRMR